MKNKIDITKRPYKYIAFSHQTTSIIIFCALSLQILLLFLTKSWNSIFIIAAAIFANVIVEVLTTFKKKITFYGILISVLQGILTGFFLPSTFPIVQVFLISFCTVFVCRFFLGKFGDCYVNVASLTVCMCFVLGSRYFPEFLLNHDILISKNPSLQLIESGAFNLSSLDTRITSFLNRNIFSLFSFSIPDGYISLLWDTSSVVPAFRFNLLTLISSIILISIDVIKPLIPSIFSFIYAVLIFCFSFIFYEGGPFQSDLLLAFLTSGFLFLTFFVLQGEGTLPRSIAGKIIYALFAGILAFLIIGPGTSPCGAVFVVLAMNIVSPLIQTAELKYEMHKVKSSLLPLAQELKDGKNA